ncbi:uncharacterized protein LOC124460255 [Drosophila willistoni]|uniref:uncharacterized protein LOC124460255 n=1 Tax=Drosophila willistoni TaxID=7260 RepID=UPI00017D73DC|nr:uncharacterized protein LOC124460255 [Drosophila willistoni]
MSTLDIYLRRRHYVKNGLWFTEDHIPVRKLFLTNIPEDLKEDTLVEHFKRFGNVISVQHFYNAGFVLFANASDATKALEMKIHHVNGHKIDVIVADSWCQPDLYGASEPVPAGDQSGEAYILKIPDDCLSMILKFLPLADQVHFKSVCNRFHSVYQLTARSIHKSVDWEKLDDLTLWECREFFRSSGPYVTDLYINLYAKYRNRLFKYFGRNCINLKSLELFNVPLSAEIMFQIFSTTSKLENLILKLCDLTDEMLLALKNLKNLRKLDLAWNYLLSGLHLEKLPVSIENLNLMDCRSIQSGHLIQMCKSLTNLRELNIAGFNSNLAKVFNYMVKNGCCPLLQTLDVSIDGQYEDIAQLPKLKSIYIHGISRKFNVTKLFDQLVLFKSEQLEKLKIDGPLTFPKQTLMKIAKLSGLKTLVICDGPNIDDEVLDAFTNLRKLEHIELAFWDQVNDSNVLRLVLGCPKLHEVKLEFTNCSQITQKLLDNIIIKIPIYYKKNERKLPITIYVDSCSNLQTPAAQDIVKIILD